MQDIDEIPADVADRRKRMTSLHDQIRQIIRDIMGPPVKDEIGMAIAKIKECIRAEVEKVENPWVVNGVPLAGDFEEARKRILEALI